MVVGVATSSSGSLSARSQLLATLHAKSARRCTVGRPFPGHRTHPAHRDRGGCRCDGREGPALGHDAPRPTTGRHLPAHKAATSRSPEWWRCRGPCTRTRSAGGSGAVPAGMRLNTSMTKAAYTCAAVGLDMGQVRHPQPAGDRRPERGPPRGHPGGATVVVVGRDRATVAPSVPDRSIRASDAFGRLPTVDSRPTDVSIAHVVHDDPARHGASEKETSLR